MRTLGLLIVCVFVISISTNAQNDKGVFVTPDFSKSYYYSTIKKEANDFNAKKNEKKAPKKFLIDVSGTEFPTTITDYRKAWHNQPISQGRTNTCWCFATISMIESDIYRINDKQVKLSEMYIVYWEYIEKAKRFVQKRGNSFFAEGSEGNAVMRMAKQHGVVPTSEYSGLLAGQKFHDHSSMYNEMYQYLLSVKTRNAWNEKEIVATIKSILNYYMGTPPVKFDYLGKRITPTQYMNQIGFIPDDYVDILSYMQQPYKQKVEYEVPDNWWHSEEYYNVPLDDFMRLLKKAQLNGFTVSIGGDVSEAGFLREQQVAIIPSFDIPSKYINEQARQFRFSNKTTTDDHGMHLVGMKTTKNGTWYLIKDSGSGSRDLGESSDKFGFYFFHEDYIKLKMMDFCVHKDAVKDMLKEFK